MDQDLSWTASQPKLKVRKANADIITFSQDYWFVSYLPSSILFSIITKHISVFCWSDQAAFHFGSLQGKCLFICWSSQLIRQIVYKILEVHDSSQVPTHQERVASDTINHKVHHKFNSLLLSQNTISVGLYLFFIMEYKSKFHSRLIRRQLHQIP